MKLVIGLALVCLVVLAPAAVGAGDTAPENGQRVAEVAALPTVLVTSYATPDDTFFGPNMSVQTKAATPGGGFCEYGFECWCNGAFVGCYNNVSACLAYCQWWW